MQFNAKPEKSSKDIQQAGGYLLRLHQPRTQVSLQLKHV